MTFPNKKYSVIMADPPWNYHNKPPVRWVGNKYSTMKLEEICALPVRDIAGDNCLLFLWSTPPCLPEAMRVIDAWGFKYKTKAFCWVKKNKVADTPFWGMGYWTRSNSEDCLLGIRGKPKRVDAGVHQIISTRVGAHSAKPAEVRFDIERLCGDVPRIELFARERVSGWDAWGDQV